MRRRHDGRMLGFAQRRKCGLLRGQYRRPSCARADDLAMVWSALGERLSVQHVRLAGEVKALFVAHPELRHHAARGHVVLTRIGDDAAQPQRFHLGKRMLAKAGGDASTPVGASDGPADLDLAEAIDDAILSDAPPDAGVALPPERPAEAVDGPMSDLPCHHLLALRQSERPPGAKPEGYLGIPPQAAVDSRGVGGKQRADLHT